MKDFLLPLFIGVATFSLTSIGLWFTLSLVFISLSEKVFLLVPFLSVVLPLFISGYMTSKNMKDKVIWQKLSSSGMVGLIGVSLSMIVTQAQGKVSWLLLMLVCGISISVIGGFFGSRKAEI